MNTGDTTNRRLRLYLLPLGALILAGLLLATWMGALAAGKSKDVQAGDAASISLADPIVLSAPAQPQVGKVFAPNQQIDPPTDGDFTFTKSYGPSTGFIINQTGVNRYTFQVLATRNITGHNYIITINDPLPTGVTWNPTSASGTNWLCSNLTTIIDCEYRIGGAGYFTNLTAYIYVPSTVDDPVENTATLRVQQGNVVVEKPSTVSTRINSLDLGLHKTASSDTVAQNSVLTYTLVITNAGPADATGIVVEDIPIDWLEPHNQSPDGGEYDWSGIWRPTGIITAGGRLEKQLAYFVTAPPGTLLINEATVSSAITDYRTENNTADVSVVVAGLNIRKDQSVGRGAVIGAGQEFNYTITVPAPSGGEFHNLVITDTLHPDLDYVRSTAGFAYNSSTRTLTYNLRSGDGVFTSGDNDIILNLYVKPSSNISYQVPITNTATVSWITNDVRVHVESNETYLEGTPGGALQVTKDDNLSSVLPGQRISYTISLTNTGNLPVSNIVVEDVMNAFLTKTTIETSSLGTATCPTATNCRLTFSNALAAGQKASFRIGAEVSDDAPASQVTRNTVTATGTYEDVSGDPQITTDTFEHTTIIEAAPDYEISAAKRVSPRQAQVNENLTFRITVNNEGSIAVPNVRVFDEFPDELDVTNVTSNRGTATLNTAARTIDVNVGELPAGATARIDVVTRVNNTVTRVDIIENEANVTYGTGSEIDVTASFRVLPSGTLPGTGILPGGFETPPDNRLLTAASGGLAAPAALLSPGGLLLALGLAGVLLGMLLLAGGLYSRARKPLRAGSYARLGLLVMALGLAAVITGWALLPGGAAGEGPAELGMLRGEKPPFSTRAPVTSIPTTIPRENTGGNGAGSEAPTNTPADLSMYLPTPTPLTLPDYPIPAPTSNAVLGPNGIPADPSAITRMIIPRLGLDAVVKFVPYNGDTWLIGGLRQEIAWMGDTSWPGLGSNTGLAGHVDLADGSAGPFWNLKDLAVGDIVKLYTEKNLYTYAVSQQEIVEDHDLRVVAPTDKPQITMITCTGWDAELGLYLQRLIVYAGLQEVQPLAQGNQ